MNQGIWLKNEKTGKYYLKRVYNHKFVQKISDKTIPIIMQVMVLLGVGIVIASFVVAGLTKTSFFESGGPLIDLGKMVKSIPKGKVVIGLAVTLSSLGLTIIMLPFQYYLSRVSNKGANTRVLITRIIKNSIVLIHRCLDFI
ncbi:hypothetical protein IMAU10585_01676 [Lactiplantibacillus plantarum]|uniref:hypothetical protein n=1 Tax=Lactiplantibacillus plantarum TaxID=1590 RepID=UPI001AAF864E|nr:hypothetical protein [Lactiplantibacillus plantarum]MBO2714927.1 hypothetical protein [Lactiplantibacillus plantarum]MCG0758399.1 hypothetical protein [Lactiplantibacillus plantarum]MCG0775681.1 hypothetical protein [Lactiplantibacillus plantarum]MCG0868577.1 hypothetical protein [Lactiplantibacillus plantarum]